MSNYPPGVTGNEYEISGPTFEEEASHFCENCDKDQDGVIQGHPDHGKWFYCGYCDHITDIVDEDDNEAE